MGENRKHPRPCLSPIFFPNCGKRFGYYLLIGIVFIVPQKCGRIGFRDGPIQKASDSLCYIPLPCFPHPPFIGGLLAEPVILVFRMVCYCGWINDGCGVLPEWAVHNLPML
jgi:hypothetical protein